MTDPLHEVAESLARADRFLLVTHENPDGDAIGSLSAMHRLLVALGRDAPLLIAEGDDPAPEYSELVPWDAVLREPPADLGDRVLVLLDCGNAERSAAKSIDLTDHQVINIDHHHDNTRFGNVNAVLPDASCTAELVWLLAERLGVKPDPVMAECLYVGLVTDTGRFMYGNTGSHAHRMAADLIEQGVDVASTFSRLYEGVSIERLRFLAYAIERIQHDPASGLTNVILLQEDFRRCGAPDGWSEGVIDYLRAVMGTKVAAVIRQPSRTPESLRVSLRSTDGTVDVSAIARSAGGGGHVRAAGFSTAMSADEVIGFITAGIAGQAAVPPADG